MLEIPWTEARDAEAVQDTLREAAQTLHQRSCRQGSIDVLPGHGKLLVSGDLHDNPFHFEALLRMARLEEGEDRHLILCYGLDLQLLPGPGSLSWLPAKSG